MITTSDIQNILTLDSQEFGIEDIYQKGNVPIGKVEKERIVIFTQEQTPETYWEKCFARVNVVVPDIDEFGTANLPRLEQLERLSKQIFKSKTDCYDGSWYDYAWSSIGREEDANINCHYVSVMILFNVLNVN